MARSWLSTQRQILGVSSCSIASYSHCLPSGRYPECSVGGMTFHLPNGGFWLATYLRSVMSSIVGPVGEASRPRPLMVTLPTEVVTVSI